MASARLQYVNVPKVIEVIQIRKKTTRRILNPKSDPEIGKYFKISAPDYSFGPFYYPESKSSIEAKDKAWKKILEKEGPDLDEINQRYLSAMRRVEKEARAAYGGDSALVDFTESEFRWMMIRDSCLFLQLTLSLLNNASAELDFPDDDPIFGKKQSIKSFMGLIKSMFLMGNQIPLVVLNELMNLKFFRSIIEGVQWWERPSDLLSKQILYDLIVDPAIQTGQKNPQVSSSLSSKFMKFVRRVAFWSIHEEKPAFYSSHHEKPSDLLHGLQLFFLGPTVDKKPTSPNESGGERPDDELEKGDLEAGIKLKKPHNNPNRNPQNILESEEEEDDDQEKQSYFETQFVKMEAIKEEVEKNKQLTLSNLTKKGIYIWNNASKCGGLGGSRGIEFKNWFLWGSIYLPPLKINHETNVLFTNLKYYEIVHQQKEVRSYLNFLANLISSYEDVNVLASNKIIDENTTSEDKERFHEMLGKLSDKEAGMISHRHQSVIGRVKDYSVFPWERFKYVAIFVFILTILQTVFGILSYFVGKDQLKVQESGRGS